MLAKKDGIDDESKNQGNSKEQGKDLKRRMKLLLPNPLFQKSVYFIVLLLFLAALILLILYFKKLDDVREKHRAMERVSRFLRKYNASFSTKNRIQVYKDVEEIREHICVFQVTNDDVRVSIDGINFLLSKRWRPFGGYMYKFYWDEKNVRDAIKFCQDSNLSIQEIHSIEEQWYFVKEVKQRNKGVWLGIQRTGNVWKWNSGLIAKKFFWVNFDKTRREFCINLQVCTNDTYCWNDLGCFERRSFYCRMKPDPRWLQK